MQALLDELQAVYQSLDANNLTQLARVYSDDIHFVDPFGEIRGYESLQSYFQNLYSGLASCRFDYGTPLTNGQTAWLPWTMYYRQRRLAHGRQLSVEGASHVIGWEKVHYHRDYFDAGALLYRHLPLIGPSIRWIDGKLRKH